MAKIAKPKDISKPKEQSRLDMLDRIIEGKAEKDELEKYFSNEEGEFEFVPRQYVDTISEGIILPRKKLLIALYRWVIPTLKGVQDATIDPAERYKMPALKVVCEIKKGHGATTLAKRFNDALEHVIKRDNGLSEKCYLIYLEKSGRVIGETSKLQNPMLVPIIVMDGIPNIDLFPQEVRTHLLSLIGSSSIFCFTEDKSQVKHLFQEEPFIIKADDFSVANILEIAKSNNYIADRDETLAFANLKIKQLLEKDVSPKSILNILTATSGLALPDHSSLHKEVDHATIEHLFHNLLEKHTEINSLESIPLDQLYEFISSKVLGQKEAVDQVVNSIAFVQYGLVDKSRPVYSFMFLGQTGVGKTELAKTLSMGLFGREDIIRIDMGEFKHSHHVEKLFGAPQGYIGYGTETKLVKELKKRTKGVLLFDEIEKAHPDVHDALLNILDAGKFTSGMGQLIDLTGYIVIMTSNALVKEEAGMKPGIGFGTTREDKVGTSASIRKKLVDKEYFSPEFINRINSVIWFNNISGEITKSIMARELNLIQTSLTQRGITFTYTEKYTESLLKQCDERFGGRDVVRKADLARFEVVDLLRKNPDLKEINLDIEKKDSSREKVNKLLSK